MKIIYKSTVPFFLIILISLSGFSQEFGNISGGFESITQVYNDKDTLISNAPSDKFASNNFFKLDYDLKNISAGIQYEAFLPAIQGYPNNFNGNGIATYYLSYHTDKIKITAGHFYDQFGSGLIFRSWENRQIGINNAVKGINIRFTPVDYLALKAVYGNQRLNLKETGEGIVRGLDIEFNILKAINKNSLNSIKIAGSYIQNYQDYTGPEENFPKTTEAYSGRIALQLKGISFDAEYVDKSKDVVNYPYNITHDFYLNYYEGNALLTNFGYSRKGIGFNMSFRRIENMNFHSDRAYTDAQNNELTINYIPALTKQHDYSLANFYVYAAQSKIKIDRFLPQAGEIGAQADLYLNLKRGTFLGGKYGTKLALNYSVWHGLKTEIDLSDIDAPVVKSDYFSFGQRYFQDINIEIRKKWHKKFKTGLIYINSFLNDALFGIAGHEKINSHIAIADITYMHNHRNAFRLELQHLQTKQDLGNWAAGTIEYTFAPKWSFFISDMYNYGNIIATNRYHYYNFGGSYTSGASSLAINYGRTKGGLLCIGGVCRYVPATTGLMITLSSSF